MALRLQDAAPLSSSCRRRDMKEEAVSRCIRRYRQRGTARRNMSLGIKSLSRHKLEASHVCRRHLSSNSSYRRDMKEEAVHRCMYSEVTVKGERRETCPLGSSSCLATSLRLGLKEYLFKKVYQEYKKYTEIQLSELIMNGISRKRSQYTDTVYSYVHKHKWKDASNIDADKTHTHF